MLAQVHNIRVHSAPTCIFEISALNLLCACASNHFLLCKSRAPSLYFLDPLRTPPSRSTAPLPCRTAQQASFAPREKWKTRSLCQLFWTIYARSFDPNRRMNKLGLAAALVLALALFHPVAATTGTVGYEAGVIAIVVVLLATLISMGIGLSVCLYRNDLIPCFANDPTKQWANYINAGSTVVCNYY